MTVLSTPPRNTEYSGVRQHRCSSTLDFCSACSAWKEYREQLNQVCPMIIDSRLVDGHGGRDGITTHRNRPKCLKRTILRRLGGKVFGSGLAYRVGRVIRNTGFLSVQALT